MCPVGTFEQVDSLLNSCDDFVEVWDFIHSVCYDRTHCAMPYGIAPYNANLVGREVEVIVYNGNRNFSCPYEGEFQDFLGEYINKENIQVFSKKDTLLGEFLEFLAS